MNKPRRYLSAAEKAAIVRRHLVEKVPVSNLADELKIQPSQIHGWIKLVLDQAEAAFERSARSGQRTQDRRVAQLEEQLAKSHQKLAKKNEVVAELMEEHVQLKKELGEL
jgi:transposase-like protein